MLSNYWATSLPLVMTNPAALGDGIFQFSLPQITGWNLNVVASTNLTTWEPLSVPVRPVWQFIDPDYTNHPNRYYRLQRP